MDGNGNKVQTLRQQFEILSYNDNRVGEAKSTSNFAEIMGLHGEENGNFGNRLRTSSGSEYHEVSSNFQNAKLQNQRIDSLMFSPVDVNRLRADGIYVSNSITLHNDDPEDNKFVDFSSADVNNDDPVSYSPCESTSDKNEAFNDNTSQGSATGAYGKVKRSNAFRKKDVVDVTDTRLPKSKAKLSLERVKSLDNNGELGNCHQKKSLESEVSRTSSVYVRSGPGNYHSHHHQQQPSKAINVVAPYQVSEIYNYSVFRKVPGSGPPQERSQYPPSVPLHSIRREGEYAIPVARKDTTYSMQTDYPPPIPPPPMYLSPAMPPQSTDRPLSVSRTTPPGHIIKEAKMKPTSNNSSASNSNTSAPPEKPPRTFLYDILSDHAAAQYQLRPQVPLPTADSTSQSIRNTACYPSSSGSPYMFPQSSSESKLRPQYPAEVTGNQVKDGRQLIVDTIAATGSNLGNKGISNSGGGRKLTASYRPAQNQTLVRSKTESQIIVKNKNRVWDSTGMGMEATAQPHGTYNMMKMNKGLLPPNLQANYSDYNNSNINQQLNALRISPPGDPSLRIHTSILQCGIRPTSVGEPFPGNNGGNGNGGFLRTSLPQYADSMSNLASQGLALKLDISEIGRNAKKCIKSANVSRCRSDDRLCEKSKSEWSLHQALNDGDNTGITSGRRNTVNNVSSNNSGSSTHLNHSGHPSLESNGSSNSTKLFRSSIQHSIQNLMNQLFSTSGVNGKDATSSTDSGIQLGSESLSSCDTPVGDSTTDTGDSDMENEVEASSNARQVVEARKGYIRQVSSFRVKELGAPQNRMISNCKKPQNGDALFECLLVVGLNRDAYTGTYHPYIKEMFPVNAKLATGVEQFCFPDSLEWPCHEGITAQSYTLAITDHRGGRKYGCCFRILPEGANMCIPIAYCLISSNRAIGFYREVLKEITQQHGCSEYQRRYWIEQLYNKSFPTPDGDVCVQEPLPEETYVMSNKPGCYSNINYMPTKVVKIRRKADHRLDDQDLISLLTRVDVTTVIKVFGSMLHERKVVLVSRALSTLSLCLEALESMLYPFTWQHTFIPILPLNMPEILDAPSPFLIGVLRSSQSAWEKNFDDGIIVDLDTNKVIRCVGDEGSILPKRIHHKLRDSLQYILNLSDQGESTKNVLFSECFIRMFVDVLGHYGSHIALRSDGVKDFERESFVESADSKATQNFLDWFTETSMFQYFIDSRLKNNFKPGIFEQRVMGDSAHHGYGAHFPFRNTKPHKNNRPFGINWLKDAFVMKS